MKQVALITGGSRGIGLGIAQALASKGFDLAINGMRSEEAVSNVLAELRHTGATVEYCRGDISTAKGRDDVIATVKEKFGRLNLLVNNAGIAPRERKDILETTEEGYDEVLSVNLRGPYFLTQQVAKWMIEQQSSSPNASFAIINVSSISATVASVNRGEYCISKAGLSMMTQLFAVRLGEYGIAVYEVRPGVIATDMTAGVKEKYDNLISKGLVVQNRWGYPEDVGKAVAAIAGGDFPYSTGHVFMVDGGMLISRL
jgi:3-oxoacyl-[acyl-carrier protein] reductase